MSRLNLRIVCLSVLVSTLANAAPEQAQSDARISDIESIALTAQQQAKHWGLTEQEWSRFEDIQAGPRGYWSPNLDPLTALGVEAQSDTERRRYAELQVKLEAQRAERELAYQHAYTAAWQRLYPGLMPVEGMSNGVASTDARRALFVEANCDSCTAKLQQLQKRGAAVDVYLVGSNNDDSRVRVWARQANVDAKQVQERRITLNHDRGRWFSLGATGGLPAVYQDVDGQWQRIE